MVVMRCRLGGCMRVEGLSDGMAKVDSCGVTAMPCGLVG